ncbi:Saccharopine dehydrogenase-domain-containing protein [Xylariales sp. PMI_506]|nr:Saccharopine dehydrogenase-domain-containing protein [Xylariales sp. PMI_506]
MYSMSFKKHDRQYDLVVYGATGYTGLMTVEHIATRFPVDLKWAVAGRSMDKVQKVVADCKALDPERVPPEIEIVESNDKDLLELAKKTFVLINVVGPYGRYGEHAVKACATAGTHYLDCTGELPWTHSMVKKYHDAAKASGAIIIPQNGLESGPSDLLTWSMTQLIKTQLGTQVGDTVVEFHELSSLPSGGTLASLLGIADLYSPQEIKESNRPYALSPVENSHPLPKSSILSTLTGLHRHRPLGLLTTSFTAKWNAAVVFRTWGLLQEEKSRHDQSYGPNFTYREFSKAKGHVSGFLTHFAISLGTFALQFSAVRNTIRKLSYQPGNGPDREESRKEYIEIRGCAEPDPKREDGKKAFGKAYYHGSMYYMTATLLASAALTILQEDLGLEGGLYTPAFLGQGYVDRLGEAGFKIESELISD